MLLEDAVLDFIQEHSKCCDLEGRFLSTVAPYFNCSSDRKSKTSLTGVVSVTFA